MFAMIIFLPAMANVNLLVGPALPVMNLVQDNKEIVRLVKNVIILVSVKHLLRPVLRLAHLLVMIMVCAFMAVRAVAPKVIPILIINIVITTVL